MKNLVCFCLVVLVIITIGSCKKKDNCEGMVCDINNHCEDGICVCDSGYSGKHCAKIIDEYLVTTYHHSSGPPPGGGGSSYYTYGDTLEVTRIGENSISTKLQSMNLGVVIYDSTSNNQLKHYENSWYAGGIATYNIYFWGINSDSIHGKLEIQQLSNSGGTEYWGHKIH